MTSNGNGPAGPTMPINLDDAQQIVGRERRKRVSQDNWSGDA